MTTEDYRLLIKSLRLRQVDIAWMMGVSVRNAKRWKSGEHPIPQSVELVLRALASGRITPRWLRKRIAEPVPYSEGTRGR